MKINYFKSTLAFCFVLYVTINLIYKHNKTHLLHENDEIVKVRMYIYIYVWCQRRRKKSSTTRKISFLLAVIWRWQLRGIACDIYYHLLFIQSLCISRNLLCILVLEQPGGSKLTTKDRRTLGQLVTEHYQPVLSSKGTYLATSPSHSHCSVGMPTRVFTPQRCVSSL